MKNAFGAEVPSLDRLLVEPRVIDFVWLTLADVLGQLGFDDPKGHSHLLLHKIEESGQEEYERWAHQYLSEKLRDYSASLDERADIVAGHVLPYVSGRILDFGCGDGRVADRLQHAGHSVVGIDVYRNDSLAPIPFLQFPQGERAPYVDASFDTVLALMMVHHSSNPEQTMSEIRRLVKPNGKIIVIESVYGINYDEHEDFPSANEPVAFMFKHLLPEEQRLANIFFDHLYNRVITYSDDLAKKVNVPFNFDTPKGWRERYGQLGLREVEFKALGIDMRLVPEYHTLHAFEPTAH